MVKLSRLIRFRSSGFEAMPRNSLCANTSFRLIAANGKYEINFIFNNFKFFDFDFHFL